jgi:hypothetical protein
MIFAHRIRDRDWTLVDLIREMTRPPCLVLWALPRPDARYLKLVAFRAQGRLHIATDQGIVGCAVRISALELKHSTSGSEPLYEVVSFGLVDVVFGIGVIDALEQLHTQLGDLGRLGRTLAHNSDVSIVCQGSDGKPVRVAFEDATRTAVIDPCQDFGL